MTIVKLVKLLAVLIVVTGSKTAMAGPIYDFDIAIEAGLVDGTIETDGALGPLGKANILSYSLVLDYGIDIFTMTTGNSTLNLGGSSGPSQLTATASNLLFDFSGLSSSLSFGSISQLGLLHLFALNSSIVPQVTGGVAFMNRSDISGTIDSINLLTQYAGSIVVGSIASRSVPEPATLALFGLGLAGLGLGRRRRPSNNC